MANTIRIKRSPSGGAVQPPTLLSGELAFSYASNTFWIGPRDDTNNYLNVRIGGEMKPGVLTANQALVANTSGGIDRIVAANVEVGKLIANGSVGNPGYVLTSAGSTSNAYWQAVSSIGVNPNAQYAWTNTHIFSNTISFSRQDSSILAYVINAASYTTGSGYAGTGGGVTVNTNSIGIGNGSINAKISAAVNSTAILFTGTSSDSDKFGGALPAAYLTVSTFTGTYLPTLATTSSVTDNVNRTYANAVLYTNTVWATVNTAITGNSGTAYSNAVTYVDTRIGVVNTAITGNAATAYTNALSFVAGVYVNTQNFSSNLTNYALRTGALFTGSINAVSYTTGTGYGTPFGGLTVNSVAVSVGNSSVNGAITTNATAAYFTGTSYNANNANNAAYLGGQPAANFANTKYVDDALFGATGGSASQAYADGKAANAYSNSVAYTDSKILTANAAITGNAATAYANAVTYADLKAANAFSNAVANAASYTDGKNATTVAFAASVAATAYSNAVNTIYANNGTFNGNNSFTANAIFSSNVYFSGRAINAGDTDLIVRNASISGNLTVLGTLTTIDTDNIRIEDASLQLASNQASTATFTDALDISVFGTFGNTANTWFTGLYRDSSASGIHYSKNVWRLYAANNVNILTTSSNTVDKTSQFYKLGTLTAYLEPYGDTGSFVVNSSIISINSASGTSVRITANNLSLVTPLAVTSGGVGMSLYNTGDIIYASSSTTLAARQIPASNSEGMVLQVTSGLPQWNTLDGGSF